MIKFRLYFDKDEETAWLNELAAKGWAMKSFAAGFYRFEACEPGQYAYQIDFGSRLFSVSDEYREFMQEAGIEIVQTWGFWVILRKLAAEGEFQLYTDVDSSIEHYKKIRLMFKIVSIIELLCLLVEVYAGYSGVSFGYAAAFLLGAMFIALLNGLVRTNSVIAKLRERKGEAVAGAEGQRFSPLLTSGLLLNSAALVMTDAAASPVKHTAKIVIQIIAIIFMTAGLISTYKKKRV